MNAIHIENLKRAVIKCLSQRPTFSCAGGDVIVLLDSVRWKRLGSYFLSELQADCGIYCELPLSQSEDSAQAAVDFGVHEGQAATGWDNCESCIDETSQDSQSTTSPSINSTFKSLQHISYAKAMKSESAATVSYEVSMVTSPGVLSHKSLAGAT
ncbi:hypothetical protein J6590_079147 [Homalodisca vitripennis]|nr:hypothetical protein J6590_079147 [Homalodisca vitripennis]